MKDHVIGVDIGTTGTKTGIYDSQGRQVGEAFEESILHYPRPGEVEQDPEDIFASVLRTIGAAMQQAGLAPGRIAAIALDGQMAGIMAVDADWNPVTHYDSWLDTRCAPWLEQLRPHEADIIRTSGMALAFNHAPKILVLARPSGNLESYCQFHPARRLCRRQAGRAARCGCLHGPHLSGLFRFWQQ